MSSTFCAALRRSGPLALFRRPLIVFDIVSRGGVGGVDKAGGFNRALWRRRFSVDMAQNSLGHIFDATGLNEGIYLSV
jgi:hypothetical protein